MTGISIPAEAEIGKGLRIHHFGGIIFHPHVKMGEHCTIYHGVTFGDKGGWGEPPKVGNHVLVGAGAKILGDITIGNNVKIGANSVVTRSIPDNCDYRGSSGENCGGKSSLPQERERRKKTKNQCLTVPQYLYNWWRSRIKPFY